MVFVTYNSHILSKIVVAPRSLINKKSLSDHLKRGQYAGSSSILVESNFTNLC